MSLKSVLYRCYTTIARKNIRCVVTAGKHVKSTWAVARQLLDERFHAETDSRATVEVLLDYNNGNDILYVVHAEMLVAGSDELVS
jgi:hypothetical protein